jgi:predicted ATPase
MITRLHIENFKSLVDFDLPESPIKLGKFVCLVGMNGSGKTTVLQALDFVAQLMQGKVREWLERREWAASDLASRIPKRPEWRDVTFKGKEHRILRLWRQSAVIPFEVEFDLDGVLIVWSGRFNRTIQRCTSEQMTTSGVSEPLLSHQDHVLKYRGLDGVEVARYTADFIYEGSILSAFNVQNQSVMQIRSFLEGLKSLELLTPRDMRRRSRKGEDIGYGGEKLSAFLDSLSAEAREALLESLKKFYPSLRGLVISTVRGGWKKLTTREVQGTPFSISATHMNDGMLRVIAILAQAHSTHPVLLFDEIENGINPELVEKLVDFLVGMKKQVIVTTHSPMILNYLEDKIAKESVYLLYRDSAGWTRSVRFFDIPEVGMKLEALGPGEVFVDTNLTKLTKRLSKRKPEATKKT